MSKSMRGALAVVFVLVVVGSVAKALYRNTFYRPVHVGAAPFHQGAEFDYAPWDDALRRWVKDDGVDYDRVLAERATLERFVATLAVHGPETTPARFPAKSQELAYYLNAYNALVLFGVIKHWPVNTVHDIRGLIEPKAGFGFFYGLRFVLDGRHVNLYNFEHKTIRGYGDARIHAAINCASKSCPPLAPFAFVPDQLDAQLDQVTRAFCAPPHVTIDDNAKTIRLSAIFDWYREDFEAHASTLGKPATVLAFIESFANATIRDEIIRARDAGYAIEFMPYDWKLNRR